MVLICFHQAEMEITFAQPHPSAHSLSRTPEQEKKDHQPNFSDTTQRIGKLKAAFHQPYFSFSVTNPTPHPQPKGSGREGDSVSLGTQNHCRKHSPLCHDLLASAPLASNSQSSLCQIN